MIFWIQNADIWHTLLFKICAKKSWFVQKQACNQTGFATENPGYSSHFWKITFLPKNTSFCAQKNRIFTKKQSIFYVKNQTKNHIFYIGLRLVSYTLPKIGVKIHSKKALQFSFFCVFVNHKFVKNIGFLCFFWSKTCQKR